MSIVNHFQPIMVFLDDEEGYFPTYAPGFLVKPSKMRDVIDGLIDYVNAYSDDEVKEINKQKEHEWFGSQKTNDKKMNRGRKKYGYIYVFKCANKYKVGYTKNIERRMNQLDVRPFKLELIFKAYSENAYDIEHETHNRLNEYSVANEWFDNISESFIIDTIKRVAEDLKCDIQF